MSKWKTTPQPGFTRVQIIEDPMSALYTAQEKYRKLERGYYRELYRLLGEAYAIAHALGADFDAWKKFIKDPFWEDRKKKPRRDKDAHKCMLYVLLFIFEAKSKHAYDRVHKYHRALELAMKEGADPKTIAEFIEEVGGIEKLYARALKADPRRAKKRIDDSYFEMTFGTTTTKSRKSRPSRMTMRPTTMISAMIPAFLARLTRSPKATVV